MSSVEEITTALSLEKKHFHRKDLEVPVIDSHLYTTFGRRLFELYQKYSIETKDQRELENLAFVLTTFTLNRSVPSKNFFQKLISLVKGR